MSFYLSTELDTLNGCWFSCFPEKLFFTLFICTRILFSLFHVTQILDFWITLSGYRQGRSGIYLKFQIKIIFAFNIIFCLFMKWRVFCKNICLRIHQTFVFQRFVISIFMNILCSVFTFWIFFSWKYKCFAY